jgi:chaperonin cofactor prefoldin
MPDDAQAMEKRIAELEKELELTRARLESVENDAAKTRRRLRELKIYLEKMDADYRGTAENSCAD